MEGEKKYMMSNSYSLHARIWFKLPKTHTFFCGTQQNFEESSRRGFIYDRPFKPHKRGLHNVCSIFQQD